MTITTHDHRSYIVLTLPVYDLREGDVFVDTDGQIMSITGDTPWRRLITELRPDGMMATFSYNCADEIAVYRKPVEQEAAVEAESESSPITSSPSTNTQRLAGIRCPRCAHERSFVVQITLNVVMLDEGHDIFGCEEPPADHFPGRVIDSEDGFFDDDPIQCHARRGGCGHRGTVKEFRVPEEVADASIGA